MHTGDLAVMREDGYCNIVGRIKDMVIRGGENIYPARDRGVPLHPPRHRGRAGDRRPRREVRRGDLRLDPDEGRRRRRSTPTPSARSPNGKLAHYKIPRYVHIVDEFPMTVTGKIRKVEMREETVKLLGL